jgi:diguanylate cyclase (GGDEF)-like protein
MKRSLHTVPSLSPAGRSQSPQRSESSRRADLRTLDLAFPSLRSEANRELSQVLRELREGADAQATPTIRKLLSRAVHCAVQQSRLQAELGSLALSDDLTGLFNRRGFLALGERQLKLARRSGRGFCLFLLDLDGLKRINDCWGHFEGDRALVRVAEVLAATFRASDIRARLGGDEFAVLAVEAAGHGTAAVTGRLREQLRKANAREPRYSISLSLGIARFNACGYDSLTALIKRADDAMYAAKRRIDLTTDPAISVPDVAKGETT